MKDNRNYDYTDDFSDIIHTARFVNAAELSGLFFSAPKWITIFLKLGVVLLEEFQQCFLLDADAEIGVFEFGGGNITVRLH